MTKSSVVGQFEEKSDRFAARSSMMVNLVAVMIFVLICISLLSLYLNVSGHRYEMVILKALGERQVAIERSVSLAKQLQLNQTIAGEQQKTIAIRNLLHAQLQEFQSQANDSVDAFWRQVGGVRYTDLVYPARNASLAELHPQISALSTFASYITQFKPEKLNQPDLLAELIDLEENASQAYQELGVSLVDVISRQTQGFFVIAILSVILCACLIFVALFGIFRPLIRRLKLQMEAALLSRQRMSYLASHDTLTGLPNRLKMHDSLNSALQRAQLADQSVDVMQIDLDGFKPINDTYGHSAGDFVLQSVAQRIRTAIQDKDAVAARLGGDEFAVVVSGLKGPEVARALAEAINAAIIQPITFAGRSLRVSCSIGIARYPEHGAEDVDLKTKADRAMYVAKQQSASICMYGDALYEITDRPDRIRNVLVDALMHNEFEMHYQPTVRLLDAKVIGAEALMRWRKPGQGLVPPGKFIPDAERTGVIVELTEFALNQAYETWMEWKEDDLGIERIGVNVPEAVLAGPKAAIFQPLAERSDNDFSWLTVEVTENVFIDKAHDLIRERLDWLKARGALIALDDFGTGYASLAHLRTFPFHCLKIDRSFVSDLRQDPNVDAIIRGVIDLARNLKASVIAEGVETESQRAFLLIDGCEVAQGFLFKPALTKDDFRTFVKTRPVLTSGASGEQSVASDFYAAVASERT